MRKTILVLLAGCVLVLVAGVGSASAEGLVPWWGLTGSERPTSLHNGVQKSEVQELVVSATKGDMFLADLKRFEATGEGFAVLPYDATELQVQEALETEVYPGRKATVTGGPGDENGTKAYRIVFPDQAVETVFANGEAAAFFGGGEKLSCAGATGPGCTATAVAGEVEKGAESEAEVVITAQNRGDTATSSPSTIVGSLPPGFEAVAVEASAGETVAHGGNRGPVDCSLKTLTCVFSGSLPAYEDIEMRVKVIVQPAAKTGDLSTGTVSGGGAAHAVSMSHAIQAGASEKFGIEDYQLIPENQGGTIDTQAGSHPFQLTNIVTLNSQTPDREGFPRSMGLPKVLVGELPTGFIGNPTPFTQCTDTQFSKQVKTREDQIITECPAQSAIGVATLTFNSPHGSTFNTNTVPIFNMKPLPGEPARFAFRVTGIVPVFLDTSVRTGKDYGVTVTSNDITQVDWLLGVKFSFWGVPGDPRHDEQRGWECLEKFGTCSPSANTSPPPFLVMPTSCEQPFQSTAYGNSWESASTPTEQATPVTYQLPEKIDGCNHLPFSPKISVSPDVPDGSTSTGLTVDVHVPQESALNPEGLAESAVKDITVALPEGVAINPAGADGLGACSQSQVGFTGIDQSGTDLFTPTLAEPFCVNASKIGTVKIKLPVLPNALEGAVYLAEQNNNPFGSLVAMYLVAEDPVSGVVIKLAGEVRLSPTGQIVALFKNSPQGPLEDAELHFFGGERAPLGTPAHCGTYTTTSSFVPWSGNEAASPSSSFQVTSGPHGSPCPGSALPFDPSLTAGTTSIQAGGFSPFTMTMSREDGQQSLQAIRLHMPPGLSGLLSSVKLCGEGQANAGTCGPESQIGETIVSVGLGGDPFSVTGGKVFITEGYEGAPYGLSIVNPAKAGPFDLGTVVVRAKIEVDPTTAALTITSDNTGPYKIPTILDGIPLQIKHVNVTINRPGFTFNPTNCNPQTITGSLSSTEGGTSALSVPLQVTNCAVLGFKPALSLSTAGKTSRTNGASLHVKLAYPKAPFGSQANIRSVKVDLPKQLPSRLSTLQKACPDYTFNQNPAACPSESRIGSAKATTPLLPVPLAGPVYFVSHAGLKFPELVVVLSGYGTTIDLHAETFISPQGITSSTFRTIPDAPVGTFELTLPQGKYSALAAPGNLCKDNLKMPTAFTAQNGATIKQNTPITVTGCAKHKKTKNKSKHDTKHKAKKK